MICDPEDIFVIDCLDCGEINQVMAGEETECPACGSKNIEVS